ncbi:hypothetical protein FRC17_010505 [Serendipita sp. 399]|nr:hypothetical protein FRC17_010505 [Serendipita sp. 399]
MARNARIEAKSLPRPLIIPIFFLVNMATSVTQQPSSFISFISATRTSSSGRSTGTGSDTFNRGTVPPDAIRFFIIAAVVLVFFGVLFFLCCISYRIRQIRMRRVVIAAFDQGVFDRERVRRRIVQLRGDAPPHEALKSKSITVDFPGYFESEAKSEKIERVQRLDDILPLAAEEYRTAADEKTPDPTFLALPIERQLALLFQANRNREKRKIRRKAQLERQQPLQVSLEPQDAPSPQMNVTILITMPHTTEGKERGDGELVFGSVAYPWPFGEAKGLSDETTRTKGLDS